MIDIYAEYSSKFLDSIKEMPNWDGFGVPEVGCYVQYGKDDNAYETSHVLDENDENIWQKGDILEVLANRKSRIGDEVIVLWNTRTLSANGRLVRCDGVQLLWPLGRLQRF